MKLDPRNKTSAPGPAADLGTAVRVEQHFAKLATIGIQPDGSITRLAFSDDESAAMAYIRAEGEALGLTGRYDAIGNLVLTTDEGNPARYLLGSHLDSVPFGGNYDGAAGVVAGLEAIRLLQEAQPQLPFAIDLVAWRGEEYTYNAVYKGSAAAFGAAEPHILHNIYADQSLRDAILQQGFDPSCIDEGWPALDAKYIDTIRGYFELHIEQGVHLQRNRCDLGIVTSIAGDRRFLVVLEGRFDHSGATPMGTRFRSDVNIATAHIQVRLDELAQEELEAGRVFTQTVGIVNADPEIDKKYPAVLGNSVTKVSGVGYFTLDLMSADDDFLDGYSARVHRLIWRTARDFNVKAILEQTDAAPGLATLDETLIAALQGACEAQDFSTMRLASGAGHDAVVVGQSERSDGTRIPVAMLFVPCKDGISHSKEEHAESTHVARGARALAGALAKLAGVEMPAALRRDT